MLLGAASYLAETRNFDGTVAVDLPARRRGRRRRAGDGGGRHDGPLRHRGGLRHAQHAGHAGRPVRASARADDGGAPTSSTSPSRGKGGHGAHARIWRSTRSSSPRRSSWRCRPSSARNVDPLDAPWSVVGQFARRLADALNVIPPKSRLAGTIRSFNRQGAGDLVERLGRSRRRRAAPTAPPPRSSYMREYRGTVNHDAQDRHRRRRGAPSSAGDARSTPTPPPIMGGEDFSFMLQKRPGAFIFLGNGTEQACTRRSRLQRRDDSAGGSLLRDPGAAGTRLGLVLPGRQGPPRTQRRECGLDPARRLFRFRAGLTPSGGTSAAVRPKSKSPLGLDLRQHAHCSLQTSTFILSQSREAAEGAEVALRCFSAFSAGACRCHHAFFISPAMIEWAARALAGRPDRGE